MKRIYIALLINIILFSACSDILDISPKNIISDDDLMTSESGMEIYMARMYSQMPFEDFKYTAQWGINYSGWLCAMGIEGTGEALNRDGICTAFTGESTPYWGMAFTLLRDANYLLEKLPDYKNSFAEDTYNHYLGEAYFVRAFVFYAMARRFGGIPLVTKVINYPEDKDEMDIPRASEEETWDQILSDFNSAISLLQPTSPISGYSNKYVALSFKSEAMLYAGSVAKYNETVTGRLTGLGQKTGVRVIGFAEDRWQNAANKYFSEAYLAAQEVIQSGMYSLYKEKWIENDPEAQYQNMVDMFSDLNSPENIMVREYSYPTYAHGYDAYNVPFIFKSPLASGTCPTADFLELFEGFDHYPDGTIKTTTGVSSGDGNYLLYDTPMDFFKDAEPRLRAYVIFPGDMFKNEEIEIRAGVYTGSEPISPLFSDYSYETASTGYQHLALYKETPKELYLSPREGSQQEIVTYNGEEINAAGANGPFYDNGESCLTGLYGRKWLVDDPSFVVNQWTCEQPFILMRYAEVLLNAAEAAIELSMAGVSSPDGSDMLQVAADAINDIRIRAGASELASNFASDEDSRNIIRKERRKELAFEHKIKWDIRRWRVQHYEGRDGFWGEPRDKVAYSNNAQYRFRGLYPFFSTESGKYFFDSHFQWVKLKTFQYNIVDYYFSIPSGEVSKSPVIDQQPNR
ncbi:RagB/SusD family nutrient uptake outer membrane protein [Plebeiibacterium sediminum]|uniref:RagB/SusD family nutrient uptake outer membrane protein n=1 Tax=Plebeiibacterium sediminum TaxID=2992112 RepID=A0AAE3M6C6_9BACT|nr:RagB/SusD family nutrient uptake outer membrane protein [Plebeiobacterium sediminum]MCW3787939.1 RagB/SusD family nutrient uptake outer membrane protein [Plebeiobacterium sediminum]